MDEPIPWHRLFGMTWMDFFHGLPVVVEMEKDLSVQQQRLDVLILRREPGPLPVALPDGFDDFGPHNLITFKSYQDTLAPWTMDELVGYYVSYRKQVSPSTDDLLPAEEFRRYAVCVRFPRGLAGEVPLVAIREGVYEARHFSGAIRVIVVTQLPQVGPNALLHLFGTRLDEVAYGIDHYERRSPNTSSLLDLLFVRHRTGGEIVGNILEELGARVRARVLAEASAAERVEGLPAEERLKGLPAEEIRKALPVEERLKGLSAHDILAALPPAAREELLREINRAATN